MTEQGVPRGIEEKLAWFRDAHFGMFIHWGVYAMPAGFWKGKEITSGTGEWIMNYARIPVAEYKEMASHFNPVKYDPIEWMTLAKEAGVKYVVVTAKHHDGFALFDSSVSDWNITQATPYGKDLIAPLARAARANGLKFGLYYSHDLDWSHPGGGGEMMEKLPDGKYVRAGGKWDPAQEGSFDAYLHDISVPQVRELLSAYRPDMIWWDYAQNITPERAKPFIDLIQADPDLISNDRLGGGFHGDLGTPEQRIPRVGSEQRDWEACMTMNDTWGFTSNDHQWKSADEIIRMLVEVASKGGNLLLNVGPTAEGTFPQEAIARLKAVGAWLKAYGDAIYGTRGGPYEATSAYQSTRRGNRVFLFLCPSAKDPIVLPELPARILAASTMGGAQVDVCNGSGKLIISVPESLPGSPVWIVKLTLDIEASALPPLETALSESDDRAKKA
jgi:alpha-L-fucosidase